MSQDTSIFEEIWHETRAILVMVLVDTLVFLLVLIVLAVVNWILRLVPYPENRKKILDSLHYFAYLVVTVMFLCDLVYGLAAFLIRKARKAMPEDVVPSTSDGGSVQ